MDELKTLNEVFGYDDNSIGIFTYLYSVQNTYKPSFFDFISWSPLDIMYHAERSGNKFASPFVMRYVEDDGTLSPGGKNALSLSIATTNFDRWEKLWASYHNVTYDPIQNYDMTEIMTNDEKVTEYGKTNTRTDNLAHSKTGTETESTTPNLTNSETKNVYGFNSTDPTPSESTSRTATGTNSVLTTYNTTDADNGTQADVLSGSDTETRNYTLTRSGNIGVTTSQQMLQSERDLWMWSFFNNVVFPDLDKVLILSVY